MARLVRLLRHRLAGTALAAALVVGACGGAARPGPVAVDPPPTAPDTVRAGEGLDPRGARLEAKEAPAPPRPWLPLGIRWSPPDPREGEAVALRLLQPRAGRPATSVEGTLGDAPVRFTPVDGGWFGVAPAPIGSAGEADLTLELRLAPDSTVVQSTRLTIASRGFPATRLSVAPRYSDPSAEALERIRREKQRITATLARATDRWLPRGPFAWPREARTTSPFGQRRLFNEELQSRHTGLDLAGRRGAPVKAAARGEVALTGHFYFAGRAVYLDHGLGVYTAYFHLSEIGVEEGETLERGDRVGKVGASGRVTGPHLHWGLYVAGHSLDPASLLEMELPVSDDPTAPGATAGGTGGN